VQDREQRGTPDHHLECPKLGSELPFAAVTSAVPTTSIPTATAMSVLDMFNIVARACGHRMALDRNRGLGRAESKHAGRDAS
jgi:hypothetical protein